MKWERSCFTKFVVCVVFAFTEFELKLAVLDGVCVGRRWVGMRGFRREKQKTLVIEFEDWNDSFIDYLEKKTLFCLEQWVMVTVYKNVQNFSFENYIFYYSTELELPSMPSILKNDNVGLCRHSKYYPTPHLDLLLSMISLRFDPEHSLRITTVKMFDSVTDHIHAASFSSLMLSFFLPSCLLTLAPAAFPY